MGDVFEAMAREHARGLAAVGELEADRVESWWSADGAHEIDVVGVTGRDAIGFVGTVKWTARPLGRPVLENLDGHASALPGFRTDTVRLLYGRTGCNETIAADARVRCYSAEALYA